MDRIVLWLVIAALYGAFYVIKRLVAKASQEERRDREGRPQRQRKEWGATAGNVKDFLAEVARRANREMGFPEQPTTPQQRVPAQSPHRPAPQQPQRVVQPVRAPQSQRVVQPVRAPQSQRAQQPVRAPQPRRVAQKSAQRKSEAIPVLGEEFLVAERETPLSQRPAPGTIAEAPAARPRKKPEKSWLDRIPKHPLARGIVLREILGRPRALGGENDLL